MATIEARHYEDARRALVRDPIVQRMARDLGVVARSAIAHDDGTPRFEFMQAANREYAARGGVYQAHIGAVAEAVLRVLNDRDDEAHRVPRFSDDEWNGVQH